MSDTADTNAGRRHFLIGVAVVAGGVVAGRLYGGRFIGAQAIAGETGVVEFTPHAFVRIGSDDLVTVIIGKSEMGQGVFTGLAIPVAEELDIDPQRIRVEFAGVDPAFNHPFMPGQFTGGSMSTWTTIEPLRKAGATARAALLAAAAKQWGVDVVNLHTADGVVTDGSRRLRYGELAALAASLPLPKDVALKPAAQFKYIGKSQHRLDGPDKVIGKTVFGIDVDLPNMLIAMVARSPVFGGKLRSFDAAAARAIPGVVDVRQVPSGVAIYATNTWAARRGRDALQLQWDEGAAAKTSTASMRAEWRGLAARPGIVAKNTGDVDKALAAAAKRIEVEYELPYLAHACMEPLNCTVHVTPVGCEIWVGTQSQSQDAQLAAQALGIEPKKVTIHTQFLGGGFGRRASGDSDFTVEAVHVANGMGRPVKTVWTREDDMRAGYYRPFSLSHVRAGVDAQGIPLVIHHTAVNKSVYAASLLAKGFIKDGVDPSTGEGAVDMPYAIANHRFEMHSTNESVPILWWRSVGNSINGFVTNTLIDELAVLGHKDPVALRRTLLADKPRHLAVLEQVVAASGYGKIKLPRGHAHGVALHECFGSIVAEIAEVSVEGKDVRVHRVTCAVDCGLAVNPNQVVAQMQSAIIFGLSAALRGEITIESGRAQQSNFNDYPVVRMNETPLIDVHIMASNEKPGGVGEPGTPPIAPAVCNAIFAATGKRIRRLPISASLGA
jgi:isoquinoline 1-oxidoreductase beta subunit